MLLEKTDDVNSKNTWKVSLPFQWILSQLIINLFLQKHYKKSRSDYAVVEHDVTLVNKENKYYSGKNTNTFSLIPSEGPHDVLAPCVVNKKTELDVQSLSPTTYTACRPYFSDTA